MAVKVTGVPLGVDGVVGLILIPVITAAVTDKLAVGEVMPLAVAVTVVLPTAMPVATPVVLLIVAILVLADAQFTCLVMSAVEAFEYVPVAVKWVFRFLAAVAVVGVMAMLVSVADVGVPLLPPPPPPQPENNRVMTTSRLMPSLQGVILIRLCKKFILNILIARFFRQLRD